jgi:hypothetical protein
MGNRQAKPINRTNNQTTNQPTKQKTTSAVLAQEGSRSMGSQAPMAHTCNPSYLDGRDQQDHGLKPAWANWL